MATDRTEIQDQIMQEALKILVAYPEFPNSPALAGVLHALVRKRTGVADPYQGVKRANIREALAVYPLLQSFLEEQTDRLYWALKIAATGNIIDAATGTARDLKESLMQELTKEFALCDLEEFRKELATAKDLLIIGDNAGETVFDRLLMESLPELTITYAVRGEPVLNDATAEDVRASGFAPRIHVVSTGGQSPGLILDECTPEFKALFYGADLVLCKGQGNYEALMEEKERSLYFLLKAKCPMLAKELGVQRNDYVFKWNGR